MKILVYLRDGRTVFALNRRRDLAALVRVEPHGEHPSCIAQRGIWNPERGLYVWTRVALRFIAKGTISWVGEGDAGCTVPPEPRA